MKLQDVRRSRLYSTRDLARKAGIGRTTLYLIEAGRGNPSLKVMKRISQALLISPLVIDEFAEVIYGGRVGEAATPSQQQY
ncbi:MAG: helix-turn-helix transcriptional regulator [Chloroflexi bacterium]|nr:helix-turn-helix transcriptional regulator [Chloroflexota bacterium]